MDTGASEEYGTLQLEEVAEHVLCVRLERPQHSNAINTRMGHELRAVFDGLQAAPDRYRCIILTGTGERAFCAGGDLKERRGMSDDAWRAQHLVFERMLRALVDCPLPVIAAVNGAAYGGGCELALACDFVYAAESARFALTEVTLGIMPGSAGTQTLPRAVGSRRALEVMLTGEPFTAADACAWGIVNRVLERDALMGDAIATATRIARNAPLATRQIKLAVHTGLQVDLRSGMLLEIEAYNRLVPTADRREGVEAFNQRRAPAFTGR
jgi:enoyl-CoA hydratase/carnithine racemase